MVHWKKIPGNCWIFFFRDKFVFFLLIHLNFPDQSGGKSKFKWWCKRKHVSWKS